ncbi:hypothetical protein ACLB1G_00095 [Oxalobacteraceae bacterium A2-2]
MSKFQPYANEADVLNIGRLSVENRLDRITLSGDLDLTADQQGLVRARELHALLEDIVHALEGKQLPDRLAPPAVQSVSNPFE